MSNLTEYAKKELEMAGYFDDGLYGGMIGKAIMELVEKFADQGHSGLSASIALNAFKKVADFQPLSPLTGASEEWQSTGYGGAVQNKRCFSVFMEPDGKAYHSEGMVFRDAEGACFTCKESSVPIEFPYVPKTEIVDVGRIESEPGLKIRIDDWLEGVKYGVFTDANGYGEYATNDWVTNLRVTASDAKNGNIRSNFRYLVWNKY